MDTSISFPSNSNSGQWGGHHSPQGDGQSRRKQKLEALLQSILTGNLDTARQAFIALVNFDLYAAKHFAQELQNRGGQLHSFPYDSHGAKHMGENLNSRKPYAGTVKIDLSV